MGWAIAGGVVVVIAVVIIGFAYWFIKGIQ